MTPVDKEIDRCHRLLRDKIRERGFTFIEVQDVLGWGRSYISRLVTGQKRVRREEVLLILNVIGVEPAEFFDELHGPLPALAPEPPADEPEDPARELATLMRELRAAARLLVEGGVIEAEELADAVAAADVRSLPTAELWDVRETRETSGGREIRTIIHTVRGKGDKR